MAGIRHGPNDYWLLSATTHHVDDYGGIAACKKAVDDFRAANGIKEPIEKIDLTGVYWRRSGIAP